MLAAACMEERAKPLPTSTSGREGGFKHAPPTIAVVQKTFKTHTFSDFLLYYILVGVVTFYAIRLVQSSIPRFPAFKFNINSHKHAL